MKNNMKKKMSIEKKSKLLYSGELLIIAILFITLAILRCVGVIGYNATRITIFNWITIVGGAWLITDFVWLLVSKKRRAKNCVLDKILALPSGIYLIVFDILCFSKYTEDEAFFIFGIAIVFFYFGANYLFQSIYHWFYPIPSLLEAIKEEEEAEKAKENESNGTEDAQKDIKESEEQK